MHGYDQPVIDYSSHFRDLHAEHVSEYFEDLVSASGVDEQANARTVVELRELEAALAAGGSSRARWIAALVVVIVAMVALVVLSLEGGLRLLALIPAAGLGAVILWRIVPAVRELNARIEQLGSSRDEKEAEAWEQLEPLNRLFRWDAARELLTRTFPAMELDPFLSSQRLVDLQATYGLSPEFMKGRSVAFSQSGSLVQNPFVIVKYIQHWIGTLTYTGTLVIHWEERLFRAGRWVTQKRTETLTAKVEKPHPKFRGRSAILFGHEAAPRVSFSRSPSDLSDLAEGRSSDRRRASAIKRIERTANRQLKSGDGQLTMMANREFEALFNALNRDHEVEFRLLFTPLAQQEMVRLLTDKAVGYGDDFTYAKQSMMHIVEPNHLGSVRLDPDPELFRRYELEAARSFFNEFHNEYFRAIYFGFAPLLTIPLLRERRSLPLATVERHSRELGMWELEAMVNFAGEERFKHPESVTQNLLKTEVVEADASGSRIEVTALGYRGIPRVDQIAVLGGDGKWHDVPVQWTEYVAVERTVPAFVGFVAGDGSPASEEGSAGSVRIEELATRYDIRPTEIRTRAPLFVAV